MVLVWYFGAVVFTMVSDTVVLGTMVKSTAPKYHGTFYHRNTTVLFDQDRIHEYCSANNSCDGGRCSVPDRPPCISEYTFITTSKCSAWTTTTKRKKIICTQQ